MMKNKHAQALGKAGGTAGRGAAKARTREECQAAAQARWAKRLPKSDVLPNAAVSKPTPGDQKTLIHAPTVTPSRLCCSALLGFLFPMSDTPRTSRLIAAIEDREGEPVDWRTAPEEWVDLARELERENTRLADEARWYRTRHKLLVREQSRFGEGKERTLLCDILANGQMLPDPSGERYPLPNAEVSDAKRSLD